MLQTLCSACRYGDHKHHVKVINAAPPGMFGGAGCPCEGECQDNPERDVAAEMRDLLTTTAKEGD